MAGSNFDVIVAGAGMLGASVAYHLTRAGLRVAVMEAGTTAGGATGNSFAWLNAVSKEPEAYHRLNAAGMAEYDRLTGEITVIQTHGGGCLEWAAAPEDQQRLEAKVERLRQRGYAVRWLTHEEFASLEPRLCPDPAVERFAYYERDAWVDAPSVARAMLDAVCQQGGEVHETRPVTALATSGAGSLRVDSPAGPMTAATVVLCAGIATTTLARELGAAIPVERKPGLLAVTAPVPEGILEHVVYAPGFHVRPDIAGGLRIGADDVDALVDEDTAPEPPPAGAGVLLRRASALLPEAGELRLARAHIGIRPVPADGLTAAGRLPGWDNVYVAVTHSGITLGPLLGRLLADEIVSGHRSELLASFRPERFAGA